MTRAERYMLQKAYPKTNIDKTKVIKLPNNPMQTLHVQVTPIKKLQSGEKILKMRKFVLIGNHRVWQMRIGRSSRRAGGKDIIAYKDFFSGSRVLSLDMPYQNAPIITNAVKNYLQTLDKSRTYKYIAEVTPSDGDN